GVDGRRAKRPPSPDPEREVQRDDDETAAKRELDESVDHVRTLVRPCARTRTPLPARTTRPGRHTTTVLELNEEDGEQEMPRDGRGPQRSEAAPHRRNAGGNRASGRNGRRRHHTGGNEGARRRIRITPLRCGRAAVVRLFLGDAVTGRMTAAVRRVHRAAHGGSAARAASGGRGLATRADRGGPGGPGRERGQRRQGPPQ